MPFHSIPSLPEDEVLPGVKVRNVYLKSTMFSVIDYEPGARIPEHRHLHEQIGFVLEGEIEMTVDGASKRMAAGDIVTVGSNVLHSSKAVEKTRVLCSCSPVMRPYNFSSEE